MEEDLAVHVERFARDAHLVLPDLSDLLEHRDLAARLDGLLGCLGEEVDASTRARRIARLGQIRRRRGGEEPRDVVHRLGVVGVDRPRGAQLDQRQVLAPLISFGDPSRAAEGIDASL